MPDQCHHLAQHSTERYYQVKNQRKVLIQNVQHKMTIPEKDAMPYAVFHRPMRMSCDQDGNMHKRSKTIIFCLLIPFVYARENIVSTIRQAGSVHHIR